MKSALLTLILAATLALAVHTFNTKREIAKPVPSTQVSESMVQTYGTNWAVELTAARTNQAKLESMLATYYDLQNKYSTTSNTPANWVGWRYISNKTSVVAAKTNWPFGYATAPDNTSGAFFFWYLIFIGWVSEWFMVYRSSSNATLDLTSAYKSVFAIHSLSICPFMSNNVKGLFVYRLVGLLDTQPFNSRYRNSVIESWRFWAYLWPHTPGQGISLKTPLPLAGFGASPDPLTSH